MRLWRLTPKETIEKAFNGEGAKKYGGRWNRKGTPLVYLASSLSLCALETLVHTDSDLFPAHYYYTVDVPEDSLISDLEVPLPDGWETTPGPDLLQEIGTNWFESKKSPLLRVPSAVIPQEFNYLLNPTHADFDKLSIGKPQIFKFDPRLES